MVIANYVNEMKMVAFPTEQVPSWKNRGGSVARDAIDPIIMIREAAQIAHVHRETLKNEARRGKIKLLRVSQRKIGVRQSELNRYLDSTLYSSPKKEAE